MTTQAITKITYIVLVEQVALVQKELQSLYLQAIVLNKQGSLLMSFVKQINSSIPNSLKWLDIAAAEVILDTDMVVVVAAAVEVPHFKTVC
jgi:hypothetical protein